MFKLLHFVFVEHPYISMCVMFVLAFFASLAYAYWWRDVTPPEKAEYRRKIGRFFSAFSMRRMFRRKAPVSLNLGTKTPPSADDEDDDDEEDEDEEGDEDDSQFSTSLEKQINTVNQGGWLRKTLVAILLITGLVVLTLRKFGTDGLEVLLYVAILLTLSLFMVRKLAADDKYFTFWVENHIKAIDIGGTPDAGGAYANKMIASVAGHTLYTDSKDHHLKFRPLKPREHVRKPFLARLIGVSWIGQPGFRSVHRFHIEKVYDNAQGKTAADWLKPRSNATRAEVSALRFKFPRPYVFTDIELSDRLTVNVKVVVMFQVVDPYIPIYVFNGDFFDQAGSLLQGAVIDILKDLTINTFIRQPKSEVEGLLSQLKNDKVVEIPPETTSKKPKTEFNDFNAELVKQVGLQIVGILIADWEASDKEIVQAIQQTALNKERAHAALAEAEGAEKVAEATNRTYAATARSKATADAAAQTLLTVSRSQMIRETVASLVLPGSDPTATTLAAASFLKMEAAAAKDSDITIVVEGGSTTPVALQTGDKKK